MSVTHKSRYAKLFVEATNNPDIIHRLLYLAKHLGKELGYDIYIIQTDKLEFQTSHCASLYLEAFSVVEMPKLTLARKIQFLICALFVLIQCSSKKRLLNYQFKSVHLGSIIYDTYLGNYSKPTVTIFDPRITITIARALSRVHLVEKFFSLNEVSALLLSHRIGLESGIFQSLANHRGLEVYSFSGDQSLAMSRTVNHNYYPYAPTTADIATLSLFQQQTIDKEFENTKLNHLSYSLVKDAEAAFEGRVYQSTKSFLDSKGRDSEGRKVIFIMAHVPNDYPNAYGINPDFCDYHEWLVHCLEEASKNDSIFWIIKEHPANRTYGFQPSYFKGLEAQFPFSHMLFIRSEEDFSVKSLETIADAIITCNGSAGFEFPALYNIPAIYYCNSFYSRFELGVSINSITELDFFLANAHAIDLKAKMNFPNARKAYTFIYSLSRVELAISPPIVQALSLKMGDLARVKELCNFLHESSPSLDEQTSELVKRFQAKGFYAIRNWRILTN